MWEHLIKKLGREVVLPKLLQLIFIHPGNTIVAYHPCLKVKN